MEGVKVVTGPDSYRASDGFTGLLRKRRREGKDKGNAPCGV
jgi:hypothetical protein